MDGLIIGYHARKVPKLSYPDICERAFKLVRDILPNVVPCVALFIEGPRNVRLNIKPEVAQSLGQRPGKTAIVFHASYLDMPWSVASTRDSVFDRIDEMVKICTIARADLVVHTGSHIFTPEMSNPVIARIAQSLGHVPSNTRVFLETMSHDPRYASPESLNAVFAEHIGTRVGLCIDTAHIWAAGADIATRAGCANWLSQIRADIPVAMHLNDSKEVLGTHHDIHTMLGKGEIWSLEDGYSAALQWAIARRAPVILERNDSPEDETRADLAQIESIIPDI